MYEIHKIHIAIILSPNKTQHMYYISICTHTLSELIKVSWNSRWLIRHAKCDSWKERDVLILSEALGSRRAMCEACRLNNAPSLGKSQPWLRELTTKLPATGNSEVSSQGTHYSCELEPNSSGFFCQHLFPACLGPKVQAGSSSDIMTLKSSAE